MTEKAASNNRGALVILGLAQFVMVVDSTVMNVSLTTVVADLNTTIVGMQTAITMFTLVMAAFMLTGGKIGGRWGARKAFAVGLVVYGIGSLITSLSPNLTVLLIGWSLLEGLGAVLVIPAIIALIGTTFSGPPRAAAFGLIGGVAGAAAAAGPLIGGWVTEVASWRYVFAAETVVCAIILLFLRLLSDNKPEVIKQLDVGGVLLSATALGIAVYGILRSSSWGIVMPKEAAPFTLLGLSPSLWMIAAGLVLFGIFIWWEGRVAKRGADPLLDIPLLRTERGRGGMGTLASMQFLIAGIFFVLPLYLQTMLGLDSLQTGIKIVPLSVAMFVAALLGARLAARFSPRRVCQAGLLVALVGLITLVVALDPQLRSTTFAVALAIFGAGAGFVMSQIGAINLAGIPNERGGEVGGLQGTAQNLGFSLGTALVGAVLLASLAAGFVKLTAENPAISADLQTQLSQTAQSGADFLPVSEVEKTASAKTTPQQTTAIVDSYSQAQLMSLRIACGLMALVAVGGLWFARRVPLSLAEIEAAQAGTNSNVTANVPSTTPALRVIESTTDVGREVD